MSAVSVSIAYFKLSLLPVLATYDLPWICFKDKLKFCEDTFYIYDEGVWFKDDKYHSRLFKLCDGIEEELRGGPRMTTAWGEDLGPFNRLAMMLPRFVRQDNWYKKTFKSGVGMIHFNNGIYDMFGSSRAVPHTVRQTNRQLSIVQISFCIALQ